MRAAYVEIYLRLLPSNRESRKMCDVIPKEPHSPDWSPFKPRLFDRRSRGDRRHLNRAQLFAKVLTVRLDEVATTRCGIGSHIPIERY